MDRDPLLIYQGGRIPVGVGAVGEVVMLELLGSGGYGSVWRVADCETGEHYALKIIQGIIPGSVDERRARMEAEVSIPSEYIVPVVGLREWDPSTFLILFEYQRGESLDRLLERRALDGPTKRRVLRETLLGVRDAHRSNIIHRDLKPGNILVGEDGRVKLIDFGVSKFKDRRVTMSNEVVGTLPYIAPEIVIRGASLADARADIYSLGHILYEMVMGQSFWDRMRWNRLEHLVGFLNRSPRPTEIVELDGFACDFYTDAPAVLTRMVKINPEDRYSAIDEVLTGLGEDGHEEGRPATPADLHLRYPLLIIESGTNRGARTLVNIEDGGALVMGRADIAGGDVSIGRRHLEFTRRGDHYFVRDLGSRNGTILRGCALTPMATPEEVGHADRIKVGDVFLRFAFVR